MAKAPRSDSYDSQKRVWDTRINMANKTYAKWEADWRCNDLERWYYGLQWGNAFRSGDFNVDPYVINLIHPTIEVKLPSLYFFEPKAKVTPKPARADDMMTDLDARAKLREDTLNTFVTDPNFYFMEHTSLALKEAFFRFGVCEIGYTADLVDNPNADKPVLTSDNLEMQGANGEPIKQPKKILNSESLYCRRISARQFRVSVRAVSILEHCDWSGYYDWVYPDDIRANKNYSNRDKVKPSGRVSDEYGGERSGNIDVSGSWTVGATPEAKKGLVKIWKIWDHRAKKRMVFPDVGSFFLLPPEDYDVLPFFTLKFGEMLDGWYPLPVVYNWMFPQQELNETRNDMRVHRKRMYRRYQVHKGSIDQPEMDKLEEGGDGVMVQVNVPPGQQAITPIQDAPLDVSILRNVPATKDDFMQISGEGGDQRAVPEATTATQAAIIDTRSKIRASFSREKVGVWLGDGLRIMLQLIEKNMALPFWIKRNVDIIGPGAPQETAAVTAVWKQIKASELGDLTYDVSVDIDSMSPETEDIQRQNWMQALNLFGVPIGQLLSVSDVLLRKTLGYFNVRSDKELSEIKRALTVVAQQQQQMQMMAMQMKMGASGGTPGARPGPAGPPGAPAMGQGASPGAMPGPIDIMRQLAAQGVGGPPNRPRG